MRGGLAIENMAHRAELDIALNTCDLGRPDLMGEIYYVGSTPIKLLTPKELGPYLRYSVDADIIATREKVENVAKRCGLTVEEQHLILHHLVRYGTMGEPTTINIESPLTEIKLSGGKGSMDFLGKVDIFTEGTGVGVIPVDKRLMEPFQTVTVQGRKMNITSLSYLIATQVNAVACVEKRIRGVVYPIAIEYLNDPKNLKDEILPVAMSIIEKGEEKATAIASSVPEPYRRDYEKYPEQMRKWGRYVGTNLQSYVRGAAKKVGIVDEGQREELLMMLVGSLRSYGDGRLEVA